MDVNGDGKTDLVLIDVGPGYPNPFQATVMLNDGTGHFGAATHSPVAEGTFRVNDFLLADFRNTGRPDLVTVSSVWRRKPGRAGLRSQRRWRKLWLQPPPLFR